MIININLSLVILAINSYIFMYNHFFLGGGGGGLVPALGGGGGGLVPAFGGGGGGFVPVFGGGGGGVLAPGLGGGAVFPAGAGLAGDDAVLAAGAGFLSAAPFAGVALSAGFFVSVVVLAASVLAASVLGVSPPGTWLGFYFFWCLLGFIYVPSGNI